MLSRAGVTFSLFSSSAANEFEAEVAKYIWHYLREAAVIENFNPLPDDKLSYVYLMDDDEKDEDIILKLLSKFDIEPPPKDLVESFGPIDTPRDIIRFLSYARSLHSAAMTRPAL